MIVAATNVIAALCLAGPLSERAGICYQLDPVWAPPRLWRDEFLNVLVTSVRIGALNTAGAETAWRLAVSRLAPHEQHADPLRAFAVATAHGLTAYDAQFVATAQSHGALLLTEDRELLTKFPGFAVSLKTFAASHARDARS